MLNEKTVCYDEMKTRRECSGFDKYLYLQHGMFCVTGVTSAETPISAVTTKICEIFVF